MGSVCDPICSELSFGLPEVGGQDDLAHVLTLVQNVVSSLCLTDGQDLIDGGLHLAGRNLGPHIAHQAGQDPCLGLRGAGTQGASI